MKLDDYKLLEAIDKYPFVVYAVNEGYMSTIWINPYIDYDALTNDQQSESPYLDNIENALKITLENESSMYTVLCSYPFHTDDQGGKYEDCDLGEEEFSYYMENLKSSIGACFIEDIMQFTIHNLKEFEDKVDSQKIFQEFLNTQVQIGYTPDVAFYIETHDGMNMSYDT